MTDTDKEKRDLILNAAMKLFFHYGFKKTAMADIAREVGLAVGTLYNFFKTKEDIVLQCAEQCKCGFIEMMREIATGELRPDDKLREMMLKRNLGYHDQFKDTPHAMELITVVLSKKKDLIKKFEAMERELIAGVLKEGSANGLFRLQDADKTSAVFLNAFSRFAPPMSIGMEEEEIRSGTLDMAQMMLTALTGEQDYKLEERA